MLTDSVLTNAAGCWHLWSRNTGKGRRAAPRCWFHEIDATAVTRFRSRAWLSATGQPVPTGHRLEATCGDPQCFNPSHLSLTVRPENIYQPPTGGRWGWVFDADEGEEFWEWIEDAEGPAALTRRKGKPKPAPKGHARGEAASKAKLTAEAVRSIRAASGVSQVELAETYGITSAAIRKILTRRSWAHVD